MLLLADYNVLKRMLNCFSIVYGNTKMSDTHKCGLERHYSTDYELNLQKIVEKCVFCVSTCHVVIVVNMFTSVANYPSSCFQLS